MQIFKPKEKRLSKKIVKQNKYKYAWMSAKCATDRRAGDDWHKTEKDN